MKYLIVFILLTTVRNLQAQTCTRLAYDIITTVNGKETHHSSEITACGDKSVASVKMDAVYYTYVTNPLEKRQLVLMDDGVSGKTAFVLPILNPDSIPDGLYARMNDADFHFTGNRKTIAGYECEEFMLELPEGKAVGYLARGVNPGNTPGLLRTNLGMVMECLFSIGTDNGEKVLFVLTKFETDLVIGDAFFSTEVPPGYSDLMEGLNVPDMPHE